MCRPYTAQSIEQEIVAVLRLPTLHRQARQTSKDYRIVRWKEDGMLASEEQGGQGREQREPPVTERQSHWSMSTPQPTRRGAVHGMKELCLSS